MSGGFQKQNNTSSVAKHNNSKHLVKFSQVVYFCVNTMQYLF